MNQEKIWEAFQNDENLLDVGFPAQKRFEFLARKIAPGKRTLNIGVGKGLLEELLLKKGVDVFTSYVNEWYNGNLQKLFFHRPENPEIKSQICAVLAGYVWDDSNPFVRKHNRIVANIAHLIDMEKEDR
jgi:16S rRNA A1518/A1519 N6-dimethyltransferase RsmA/KsgA/DIM1 with predicted DNA glycosylase/AP lyase activity